MVVSNGENEFSAKSMRATAESRRRVWADIAERAKNLALCLHCCNTSLDPSVFVDSVNNSDVGSRAELFE